MDCDELTIIRDRLLSWLSCDYPEGRHKPEAALRRLFDPVDYRTPSVIDRACGFIAETVSDDASRVFSDAMVAFANRTRTLATVEQYDELQEQACQLEWWCGSQQMDFHDVVVGCDRIALLEYNRPADINAKPSAADTKTAVMLDEEDVRILEAAKRRGADKHIVKSNVVYSEAFGAEAGDMPRSQRERLKLAGMIHTKRGGGFMLTPEAVKHIGQH